MKWMIHGSFFWWEKPWEKPMKKPLFAGKKRDMLHVTCSKTSCQVQHACLPQAMLGTDVLCQVRSHSTEAIMGWSDSFPGGEIRHGQDGGLCAGLPAEFRDLQERRKPSHQTVVNRGMVGQKNRT